MSSTRSSASAKWYLVEFKNGARDVISVNSVVTPEGKKDLKAGDILVVNTRGTQEPAKLITRARERETLEAMQVKDEEGAGPSRNDDDGDDFSESSSDWLPNDKDEVSCDSEKEDVAEKVKLERYRRQYSRSKKTVTPSNRAKPVPVKKSPNRKRTYASVNPKNPNIVETLPDSTNRNEPRPELFEPKVPMQEVNLEEIMQKNEELLHKIREKRNCLDVTNPQRSDLPQNQQFRGRYQKALVMSNLFCKLSYRFTDFRTKLSQVLEAIDISREEVHNSRDYTRENIVIESEHEESNSSGDNVLISNRYSNIGDKKVQGAAAADDREWIPIGSGTTHIHRDKFRSINWKSYTIATRSLLLAVFPRHVLATHSLTGKASPAFQNRPAKMCLDPRTVTDVILEVMSKFNVQENLIRNIITTKCADECKMWKMRTKKRALMKKDKPEEK